MRKIIISLIVAISLAGCDLTLAEFARDSLPNDLIWTLSSKSLHWTLMDMLNPQIVETDGTGRVVRTEPISVPANMNFDECRPYQRHSTYLGNAPLANLNNEVLNANPNVQVGQLQKWNESGMGMFTTVNTAALYFVRDNSNFELQAAASQPGTINGQLAAGHAYNNIYLIAVLPTLRFDLVPQFSQCLMRNFAASIEVRKKLAEPKKSPQNTVRVRMLTKALIGFMFGLQIREAKSMTNVDVGAAAANARFKMSLSMENISLAYQQHGLADFSTSKFIEVLQDKKDASAVLNALRSKVTKMAVIAFGEQWIAVPALPSNEEAQ